MKKLLIGIIGILFVIGISGCGKLSNCLEELDYNYCRPKVVNVHMDEIVIPDEPQITKIEESIMFDHDSSEIRNDQMPKIIKVSDVMHEYPDTLLILEGYASVEGAEDYNEELSFKRANAVKDALIDFGVDPDRIESFIGYGETDMFGTELYKNRKVLVLSVD